MKAIIFLYVFLLIPVMVGAQQMEHCTTVNLSKGSACGNSPNSVRLTINADSCGQTVYAKACFEIVEGSWECLSDEIYSDEGDYSFSQCQSTGSYTFDVCAKGENGYECGYSPTGDFLTHTCSDNKIVEYDIAIRPRGIFKVIEKNGTSSTINSYRSKKDGSYYLKTQDIELALCKKTRP